MCIRDRAIWHENLMPVCKELGITYVAFSPLANGALTGAYQSKKAFGHTKALILAFAI